MTTRLVSLEKLLMRPRPALGESWQGYLCRLADFNGLSGFQGLSRVLSVSKGALLCGRLTVGKSDFGIEVPPSEDVSAVMRKTSRFWAARVCPLCIDHVAPIYKACWDFPLKLRCSYHGCMLIDRCEKCKKEICHDRQSLTSCQCGADFCKMAAQEVPPWVFIMESAYEEAFKPNSDFPSGHEFSDFQSIGAKFMRFSSCSDQLGRKSASSPKLGKSANMISSDDFHMLREAFTHHPLGFSPSFEKWYKTVYACHLKRMAIYKGLEGFCTVCEGLNNLRMIVPIKERGEISGFRTQVGRRISTLPIRFVEQSTLSVFQTANGLKISTGAVARFRTEKARRFLDFASSNTITSESVRRLFDLLDKSCVSAPNCNLMPSCGLAYALNTLARIKIEDGCCCLLQAIADGKFAMHAVCAVPQSFRDYRIRQSDFFRWCAAQVSAG